MNVEGDLKKVILVIDLALGLWLLWMLLPPAAKLAATMEVERTTAKIRGAQRRKSIEKQMRFEIYLADEAISDYNRTQNATQLASDLAA